MCANRLPRAVDLKINEIFYSIQGESLLAGKPTVFVRLSTCNLRCTWCDTRHSFWKGSVRSIQSIVDEVDSHGAKYVCVTGGEPLGQQGVYPLLEALLARNYMVSLETNGSFSIKKVPAAVIKVIDVKCPDSGEEDSFAWENIELAGPSDQFKFVVASRADFEWSREFVARHELTDRCAVLFSPVHGKVAARDLADWILESRQPVTLQSQMHKELWGPNTKGV